MIASLKLSQIIMNKTPVITFYTQNLDLGEGYIFGDKMITRFLNLGFDPLIDNVHGTDYDWMMKNFVGPVNFFYYVEERELFSHHDVNEMITEHGMGNPIFSISFNHDVEMPEGDWNSIHSWVQIKICLIEMGGPLKLDWSEGDRLMVRPAKITQEIKVDDVEEVEKVEKPGDLYRFFTTPIPEKDIMVYKIEKPFTDLPYVTYIEKYSVVGHLPFFTSLFVCDSWGVSNADLQFLGQIWNMLEMEGKFDLDVLLRNHVEECRNGKPEPRVYRKEIQDVVDMIMEQGSVGEKRKRFLADRFTKRK